jgi:hypothetical protein
MMTLSKKMFLALTAFAFATGAFAADKPRIEEWKKEGLVFAARDEAGRFKGWANLELESWNDGDERSEWIARQADGTFATGYKGLLEKFRVGRAGSREQARLVIRDKNGQFVTWEAMDKLLTSGWERTTKGDWRYTIRYKGQFVNWAEGKLENWGSRFLGAVLVVRDTADSSNNGKILTWIAPEKVGSGLRYRDPQTGRFVKATK